MQHRAGNPRTSVDGMLDSRVIELTQGHVAIVDAVDCDFISQWQWHVDKSHNRQCYALRTEQVRYRTFHTTMHQLLIGDVPAGQMIHHLNGWGLDNRRSNLLVGPAAMRNILRPPSGNPAKTSPYKGVTRVKPTPRGAPRWRASIMLRQKQKYLGIYESPEEAAAAYDLAAVKNFGPYAYVNFATKRPEYIARFWPPSRPWPGFVGPRWEEEMED